jgi:altronate dehydratase
MEPSALVIEEKDNVAVALEDIPAGTEIVLSDGRRFAAVDSIPYSHKVALVDMSAGDTVTKYGESIGRAAGNIKMGEWVHTHNLKPAEEI